MLMSFCFGQTQKEIRKIKPIDTLLRVSDPEFPQELMAKHPLMIQASLENLLLQP